VPAPPEIRAALDAAVDNPERLDATLLRSLAALSEGDLDETLRGFAQDRAADALPLLTTLAGERAGRVVRRVARRALYRLAQRGVTAPSAAPSRPVVERREQRATRAWLSGIDASGSRAIWVLFEDTWGGAALCSLIVNDTLGISEVAGDAITKKRLERELATLRAAQKLPWIETEPARAVRIVAEARALHRTLGTSPPAGFTRWEPIFDAVPEAPVSDATPPVDPALAARGGELLELPELAGWFFEPEQVQSDSLELGGLRESRLVVSDQIKKEREEAIVGNVVEREMTPEVRHRWARRLRDMAHVFVATGRSEPAGIAAAAAAALDDDARDVRQDAFARALARRALDIAAEVAAGRLSAAEASRKPRA
jgi:hypothetical protein